MISKQRSQQIISNANIIKNNPDLMKKHMWKTNPCVFGFNCKRNPTECAGAHFIEEYRPPLCLYLEICQNISCEKFHPNRCSLEDYIKHKKIDTILMNQKYIEVMTNPELLREHLYRTRKCFNGLSCSNKEKCQGAHFLSEYRLPVCLKMEFCCDKNCQNFHEGKQTKENYMISQGILFEYNTYEEYEKDKIKSSSIQNTIQNTIEKQCSLVKEDLPCSRNVFFVNSLDDILLKEYKAEEREKNIDIDDIDVIIDFHSISHIIRLENEGIIKKIEIY